MVRSGPDLSQNLNFVNRLYREKVSFSEALREGSGRDPGGIRDEAGRIRKVLPKRVWLGTKDTF